MSEVPEQETFKYLTEECGPHCGAIATIGGGHMNVGHCDCKKFCHGRNLRLTAG